MILKRGFLLFLLLCAPFVSMADDYNVSALEKTISVEPSETNNIKTVGTSYEAAVNAAVAHHAKASNDTKNAAKKSAADKVQKAKGISKQSMTAEQKARADAEQADKEKKAEEAKKAYEDAKAKEQSTENKMLGGLTMAATGIGGMELMQGLSEQKADKAAEADMSAYIETMRCTYAEGKQVKAGPEEIELPGGNDATLMKLRTEYLALAKDLKERKEALGMKPGIEAEEILDKANIGLYDDENVGITGGHYGSLYRAQMLGSEKDQAKIDEAKSASSKRVKGGAIALAGGAAMGILGNSLINGKLGDRLKAAKDKKAKDSKSEDDALSEMKNCLKSGGAKDTDKLSFKKFAPSVLHFENIDCNGAAWKSKVNGRSASALFVDTDKAEDITSNLNDKIGEELAKKLLGVVEGSVEGSTDIVTEPKDLTTSQIESALSDDSQNECASSIERKIDGVCKRIIGHTDAFGNCENSDKTKCLSQDTNSFSVYKNNRVETFFSRCSILKDNKTYCVCELPGEIPANYKYTYESNLPYANCDRDCATTCAKFALPYLKDETICPGNKMLSNDNECVDKPNKYYPAPDACESLESGTWNEDTCNCPNNKSWNAETKTCS